jgi:hypothetical protein
MQSFMSSTVAVLSLFFRRSQALGDSLVHWTFDKVRLRPRRSACCDTPNHEPSGMRSLTIIANIFLHTSCILFLLTFKESGEEKE